MRMLSIFGAALLISTTALAIDLAKPIDILEKEGQFLFVDGSSYYLFNKDHSFESGPLSLSGRTIRGTWKQKDDHQFIVEGKWAWVNGVYALNDRRRLIMSIQPPCIYQSDESKNTFIPRHMISPPRIYKCYFTVDELVKTGDEK